MSTTAKTQTKNIHESLAAIMAAAGAIGKESRNETQRFYFRGIDAVMNHLHPVFAKHGVVILPEILENTKEDRITKAGGNITARILRVRFTFAAADGSSVSVVVDGEAQDTGDKSTSKAMAIALKYALTQMLLLPYDEIDPDASTPPASQPAAKARAPIAQPVEKRPEPVESQPPQTEQSEPPKYYELEREKTASLVIEGVGEKTGVTGKGKPWVRTYARTVDGEYYSTFDRNLGENLKELEGHAAVITYVDEQGPRGVTHKVLGVRAVLNEDVAPPRKEDAQNKLPF